MMAVLPGTATISQVPSALPRSPRPCFFSSSRLLLRQIAPNKPISASSARGLLSLASELLALLLLIPFPTSHTVCPLPKLCTLNLCLCLVLLLPSCLSFAFIGHSSSFFKATTASIGFALLGTQEKPETEAARCSFLIGSTSQRLPVVTFVQAKLDGSAF